MSVWTVLEHQFTCGLSLAIGKEAQLSRSEIQKVVEFYRVDKDRVRYKEFCDMLENAFTIPDLEKKLTTEVVRPPEGALGRVNIKLLLLNQHSITNVSDVQQTVHMINSKKDSWNMDQCQEKIMEHGNF